ncbi:hypothetical protein M758_12G000600 [Ceratodon purpureus]|nr:hypothetical protein M758_12G000600 [Ceratodon purpureus]
MHTKLFRVLSWGNLFLLSCTSKCDHSPAPLSLAQIDTESHTVTVTSEHPLTFLNCSSIGPNITFKLLSARPRVCTNLFRFLQRSIFRLDYKVSSSLLHGSDVLIPAPAPGRNAKLIEAKE